ncbi:MAG TPA: aldo/keto reductase [Oligoflexia bacterium]|nr:aldo/keto reductase [Oligoflexia bacterium]HMR25383.1 aldo/keto reductase [Oligoflexia bacterium]
MIKRNFLGSTELEVSKLGFGTYRVDARVKTHEQALTYALDQGINLMDTSSNYMHGYSEQLIGKVINQKIKSGQLKRKDCVIVSKVGYVQGETLKKVKQNQEGYGQALVKINDQHWHCLAPHFIQQQIDQSLQRMQLEHIDVYLLHNPEYLLPTLGEEKFYSVIELAFAALETAVAEGKIKYYGISSNTFALKDNQVNLDKVWACANKVNVENHFRVIQFPLNLFESGAVLDEDINLLEKAQIYGLGTLANRPLNAFTPAKELFRLVSFNIDKDEVLLDKEVEKRLQALVQWEKEFKQIPIDEKIQPFFLGHVLYAQKENITDLFQWQDLYRFQIHPLLENSIKQLSQIDEVRTWLEEYTTQSMQLIQTYTDYLKLKAQKKSGALMYWLDKQSEDLKQFDTLSQKVLSLYQALPDLSSVLVGMREEKYVEDVLNSQANLNEEQAKQIIQLFKDVAS